MPDVRQTRPAERDSFGTRLDVAAALAAAQHGVVEHDQLVAGGLSRSAISRQAASGRLRRRYHRVYAVGHDALTPEGHWMAAVLAGGPGTVLSHRASAAAWGLRPDNRRAIDITSPNRRGTREPGLTVHRCRLDLEDVTTLRGIPITTAARTLLDLAEVVPERQLLRAAVRAEELHLFDLRAIEAALARGFGRRGVRPLRAVLDELVGRPTGSKLELEARALDLVRRHRLPAPVVNALVLGHEVDLHWPRARLVVELDSWTHHRQRPAFERDRRRDVELQAAGYRTVRLTWRQVVDEPAWVADRLAALLATAGAARRS